MSLYAVRLTNRGHLSRENVFISDVISQTTYKLNVKLYVLKEFYPSMIFDNILKQMKIVVLVLQKGVVTDI